jgi:hypothetical protein
VFDISSPRAIVSNLQHPGLVQRSDREPFAFAMSSVVGQRVAGAKQVPFRYLDEQAFRYNNRATKENKVTDADRFNMAISNIVGKRLTFAQLTGKVGATTVN